MFKHYDITFCPDQSAANHVVGYLILIEKKDNHCRVTWNSLRFVWAGILLEESPLRVSLRLLAPLRPVNAKLSSS